MTKPYFSLLLLIWVTILDLDTFTLLAYTESKGNREGERASLQVLKKCEGEEREEQ